MNVTKKSGSFHEFHLFYIVATHGILSRIIPFRSGISFLPVITLFQKVIRRTIYYIIILRVFILLERILLLYTIFIIILSLYTISIFISYKQWLISQILLFSI